MSRQDLLLDNTWLLLQAQISNCHEYLMDSVFDFIFKLERPKYVLKVLLGVRPKLMVSHEPGNFLLDILL
jgi:hypothetical protein